MKTSGCANAINSPEFLNIIQTTIWLQLLYTRRLPYLLGHSHRLRVPPSGVDCHLFSFLPSAIKLWNSLPSHLVEINSLEEFKAACFLDEHNLNSVTLQSYIAN